jgi:hypothetical protein
VVANILLTPIFCVIPALRIGRYSLGESPPKETGQPAATSHLVTAWGEEHLQTGEHQWGLGEASYCGPGPT